MRRKPSDRPARARRRKKIPVYPPATPEQIAEIASMTVEQLFQHHAWSQHDGETFEGELPDLLSRVIARIDYLTVIEPTEQAIREWEARPKAERDAEVAKAKERRAARCAAAQKGLITRARNRAAREAAGTKDQAKEERTEGARSATDTRGSVATPQRDSRGALR